MNAAIARGKAAVETEQGKTQQVRAELDQVRIDHQAALEAEQTRSREVVNAAIARGKAAVEAEKANTRQVRAELEQAQINHQTALAAEQARSREAVAAERARGEDALMRERENNQRTQKNLEQQHNGELAKLQEKIDRKEKENFEIINNRVPMTRICGLNVPTIAKSLVILAAVVGLVVGLISGGVLGGVIGSKLGKREIVPVPPVPSTQPVMTTQATEPPETTMPVETTQPTVPQTIQVDGEINWDYVYQNMSDIVKLEYETVAMEALLNEMNITAESRADDLEAVLTFSTSQNPAFVTVRRTPVEQQEPAQSGETTADPDEAPMVTTETNEDTTEVTAEDTTGETAEETEPVMLLLAEMEPFFVADNGTYRFEIFCEPTSRSLQDAVAVVQQFLCELPEDPAKMILTAMTAEGKVIDLHGLMTEVSGNELWWKQSFKLDLDEDNRYTKQNDMGTSRMPAVMIQFEDETEALVYDYSENPQKREAMVGILEKKGYDGAFNKEFVIGLTVKQEAAASTQTSSESQGEA